MQAENLLDFTGNALAYLHALHDLVSHTGNDKIPVAPTLFAVMIHKAIDDVEFIYDQLEEHEEAIDELRAGLRTLKRMRTH